MIMIMIMIIIVIIDVVMNTFISWYRHRRPISHHWVWSAISTHNLTLLWPPVYRAGHQRPGHLNVIRQRATKSHKFSN